MGRKKKTPPTRKTYAIIVDGKTEVWYFNMLKRNERQLRINIKPELPSKKTISQQYENIIESVKNNTKVFWVVDFDTILKETRESNQGAVTPLQEFDKYRKKLKKNHPNNVVTIINSPCLEFWFLLHFESTAKFYDNGKKVEKKLKKYISEYEKTQMFFTRENKDIYLQLKPYLETALKNSQKLGDFDVHEPFKALAEMHLFFLDDELRK